jgi:hypothetical protein
MSRLLENDNVISLLMEGLNTGEGTLEQFPKLLKRVLREDMWRERQMQANGRLARFERFEEFVATPPREGLGASVGVLKNLCRDDVEALDLIDQATKHRDGNPRRTFDNIQGSVAPTGTARPQALRKLRADRPDLHARVLKGELSPHAAMLEAGFRRPTFTAPADNIDDLATVLRRRLDHDQRRELAEALLSD